MPAITDPVLQASIRIGSARSRNSLLCSARSGLVQHLCYFQERDLTSESVIDLGGPYPCLCPGPPGHRHAQARPSCDWACLCPCSETDGRAWACLRSFEFLLGVPVPCPVPEASGTVPHGQARIFVARLLRPCECKIKVPK